MTAQVKIEVCEAGGGIGFDDCSAEVERPSAEIADAPELGQLVNIDPLIILAHDKEVV
jgi:hypothetical protein